MRLAGIKSHGNHVYFLLSDLPRRRITRRDKSCHQLLSYNIPQTVFFKLLYTIICIYAPDIGIMVRVFANGSGDLEFNLRSSHTKNSKNGT